MDLQASGFGTEIGGTLQLADVLGFHALTGSARYSTAFHAPSGSVVYQLSQLLPTFTLGFGRSYAQRTGFSRFLYDHVDPAGEQLGYFVRGYTERITQVRAGIDVPVFRHPIHNASASLNYSYTQYTNVDQEGYVDPNAPASSLPEVGGLGEVDVALAYNNFRAVRYGYNDETGRAAGVRMSIIDPHLGGRFGDLQITANYSELLRMPWRGHQVPALRGGAGASAGGLGRRPAFFIGGLSQQEDVIRALLMRSAMRETGALRGFQPLAYDGRYYTVLNMEYRIPVADVERGLGTDLPLFMRRITMIPFTDIGGAWTNTFTRKVFHVGVGAALVLSFKLGYADGIDLFLQSAHGFDEEFGPATFRAAVNRSF